MFSSIRVTRSLLFCVVFCRSLFVIFFWELCCLSVDLRILITPLVSSYSFTNWTTFIPEMSVKWNQTEVVTIVVYCRKLRKAGGHQVGNQRPLIDERQTIQ